MEPQTRPRAERRPRACCLEGLGWVRGGTAASASALVSRRQLKAAIVAAPPEMLRGRKLDQARALLGFWTSQRN